MHKPLHQTVFGVQMVCKSKSAKMTTNIVIALDTRRMRADSTYPLIMRLGHRRKTLPIPLQIYLLTKDWNEEKRLIRNSVENSARLNNRIAKRKAKAIGLIEKLQDEKMLEGMPIIKVRAFIEKYLDSDIENPFLEERRSLELMHAEEEKDARNFFTYAATIIRELTKAKRVGTRDSYQDAVKAIEKFHGSKELDLQDLNYEFLKRFETNHYAKSKTANGLAAYLRTIRAIYNSAIKADVVDAKFYPFRKYTIKTVPTKKIALQWPQLEKIITLKLAADHPLFNARNYFVAAYMMYGMSFMDMAFFEKKSIVDGRVNYRRTKTSKLYDIKITPALQEILSYYSLSHPAAVYVFPVIKRDNAELQHKDVEWARKRYNKRLKELAKMLDIEAYMSTKVVRHSFATQAMLKEVPMNVIKEMLGHSSVKTTEIYLASLPSSVLDNYNEKILLGTLG